jgi:hypothetical protein
VQTHKPYAQLVKPALGMTFAFTPGAGADLAGIPATVVYVWPRFRSGEYLVTLEFPWPVKYGREVITQLDAFLSELEPVPQPLCHRMLRPLQGTLRRGC